MKHKLKFSAGKRFIDLVGQIKRGRAAGNDLHIFNLVGKKLESETDIFNALRLIDKDDSITTLVDCVAIIIQSPGGLNVGGACTGYWVVWRNWVFPVEVNRVNSRYRIQPGARAPCWEGWATKSTSFPQWFPPATDPISSSPSTPTGTPTPIRQGTKSPGPGGTPPAGRLASWSCSGKATVRRRGCHASRP